MDPTTLATAKKMNEITKPYQKGFINYCLVTFFGDLYKDYLKNSILIHKEAEYEANKEFEDKISNIEMNPDPVLKMIQKESEVEYKNMAGVLVKASQKIIPDANGKIDPDKVKRLKDLSKEFSSEEMQEYIAGILAGEYNKPGSYSLQTMSIVKNLSKEDIELFQKFVGLVINGYFIPQNITGKLGNDFRQQNGFEYMEFLYLQELGLIAAKESALNISVTGEGDQKIGQTMFSIGNRNLFLKCNVEKTINIFTVTNSGREIMQLIKWVTIDTYYERLKQDLQRQGFETEYIGEKK